MKINRNITTVNRTIHTNRKIEYLVIHYVGAFGNAEQNSKYFKDVNRRASAHYFVDPKGVWQVVEDKDASWHCGDAGSGEYKDVCRNANSIGIEMCVTKMNRSSPSGADTDWYFEEKTVENTIALVQHLMDKHNIPLDRVIRHYDVTHKWCPRPYVGNDVNKYYKKTGNQMWAEFKRSLIKGEKEMTGKEIYNKLNKYLKTLPTSGYAREASKKGVKSGLFVDNNKDGLVDDPRNFMTREQLVTVLDRAGLLDGEKSK